MLELLHLFFHFTQADAVDRAGRRQMALNALNHPARISVDPTAAAPIIQWARECVRLDLEKPESAAFSDERAFQLPDNACAGAGIVECTNVIGARACNWYLFLVRPDGVPVTVEVIDIDPGGAPRTPVPPPLPSQMGKR